ncbi:MAG TPA: phosphopantetheine-binding protein [Polyangiaceae bacterium]|nr:phosphopantetheine-binding protein [Polyangiaceae bacterium]
MTRDNVKAVVIKHLAQAVDTIDAAKVDTSQSMKALGANSLDIVEVVSAAMRELKIKIPRSELAKLTNVDQLVDLLHNTAEQTKTQAKTT